MFLRTEGEVFRWECSNTSSRALQVLPSNEDQINIRNTQTVHTLLGQRDTYWVVLKTTLTPGRFGLTETSFNKRLKHWWESWLNWVRRLGQEKKSEDIWWKGREWQWTGLRKCECVWRDREAEWDTLQRRLVGCLRCMKCFYINIRSQYTNVYKVVKSSSTSTMKYYLCVDASVLRIHFPVWLC